MYGVISIFFHSSTNPYLPELSQMYRKNLIKDRKIMIYRFLLIVYNKTVGL